MRQLVRALRGGEYNEQTEGEAWASSKAQRFSAREKLKILEEGRCFSPEQRRWLEAIRDHIAGSVSMGLEDI